MSSEKEKLDSPHKSFMGKYVLDSISFGMYDSPFMALREYIQNSTDAIDDYRNSRSVYSEWKGLITLTIDGRNKSIQIKDNGIGVSSGNAWHVLHDLGRSSKDRASDRGFRGIGRLGGLGYCDELRFITKSASEDIVSTSTWNCTKLRHLVNSERGSIDASSLIEDVTFFEQKKYLGNEGDHFFKVEMINVKSSKDLLLNVPAVKSYLSQVSPVPFNKSHFRFSENIDIYLRGKVPSYELYQIEVNGEPIYKPYSDRIKISEENYDEISGIQFFQLADDSDLLAYGWMGEVGLKGRIEQSSLISGIRVRCGNIQIGDKDLLSGCYREKRFNDYMLGEIHIVDNRITPNSRRDNFEDSHLWDMLLICFIRDVGVPYSRKIRELSEARSRLKSNQDHNTLCERAEKIIKYGYYSEYQRDDLLRSLGELSNRSKGSRNENIGILFNKLQKSKHILSRRNGFSKMDRTLLVKTILDIIYEASDNKVKAEETAEKILTKLSNSIKK